MKPLEQIVIDTLRYLSEQSDYYETTITENINDQPHDVVTESNQTVQYIAKVIAGAQIRLTDNTNTESRGISVVLRNQKFNQIYHHLLQINNPDASPNTSAALKKRVETLSTSFRKYNISKSKTVLCGSIITNAIESYFFLDKEQDGFVFKMIRVTLPTGTALRVRSKVEYHEMPIDLTTLKQPTAIDFSIKSNRGGARPNTGNRYE
ncbi:hypothetical protein [Shewanella sp. M-Br]|uniref:hypothetical protein n=1 Tax=Shewanella sp. M-Br TaxID=2495595 RepID=UPI00294A6BE4|nr:hypothetical protein SMBr_32740 [Shewanella sp. M-Br]